MPAYSLTGISWIDDFTDIRTNLSTATLSFFAEDDSATVTFTGSPSSFFVQPNFDSLNYSWIDDAAGPYDVTMGYNNTYPRSSCILYDLEWAGHHTTALITITNIAEGSLQRRALFVLDGAPLPEFANADELNSFYDSVTARTAVTSGPFAMGTAIPLSAIPTLVSGSPLEIFGTDGNDVMAGTVAGDIFHPGHNTTRDTIIVQGNDLIDLTGAASGDHYRIDLSHLEHVYSGVQTYIGAQYAQADFYFYQGEVTYSVQSATMVGVMEAMRLGSLEIIGTATGDTFYFITEADSFISLMGGGGNDGFLFWGTGTAVVDFSDVGALLVDAFMTNVYVTDTTTGQLTSINIDDDPAFTLILRASYGADTLNGGARNDIFIPLSGNDTINGADGFDTLRYDEAGMSGLVVNMGASRITGSLNGVAFTQQVSNVEAVVGAADAANRMTGRAIAEQFTGGSASDTLDGGAGNDTLAGGDGADTLIGGDGDDSILGGATSTDLRDVVYAGAGNDWVDGGYGNDSLRGDDGNDTIEGGFGADTVVGGTGNDVLTGSAWSDQIFGNDGDDFINGGFGNDRLNGGTGADRFYHVGVAGHGSDWVQDYSAAEGDRLVFANSAATREQFQINWATTPGAGDGAVQEAFVVYRPTGQILWALIDGAANDHIWLQIGTNTYDLMA